MGEARMSALEDYEVGSGSNLAEKIQDSICRTYMIYQRYVDRTTPYKGPRWIGFVLAAFLFLLRIVTYQGFYVVTYAWAIYLLNIFILFLTPKFIPMEHELDSYGDISDDAGDAGGLFDSPPQLPISSSSPPSTAGSSNLARGGPEEEFRPFIRRLPEFKFWYNSMWATGVALGCTLFESFDIPVFWPILVMYFFFLFFLTMRRQVHHMIKHRYIPFDLGKKSYTGIGRK